MIDFRITVVVFEEIEIHWHFFPGSILSNRQNRKLFTLLSHPFGNDYFCRTDISDLISFIIIDIGSYHTNFYF